jgi:hypothetical protein
MRRVGVFVLAGVAAIAACFDPAPNPGLPCSPLGDCPDGLTCDESLPVPTCVDPSAIADAAIADGAADADPPDASTACGVCPPEMPVCDGVSCRGCTQDVECASAVCHEFTGECVDEADSLYLQAGATGDCSRGSPCGTMVDALARVTSDRQTIRIADGDYASPGAIDVPVIISGTDRAPAGARFASGVSFAFGAASGPSVVEGVTFDNASDAINSADDLTLFHVDFPNISSDPIQSSAGTLRVIGSRITSCGDTGIDTTGGTLIVERSVIVGCNNSGIRVSGARVDVSNTIVAQNGALMGVLGGGITLLGAITTPSRIEHVTLADNVGPDSPPGIACTHTSGSVVVSAAIIAGNSFDVVGAGPCTFRYSLFGAVALPGMNNITGMPMYADAGAGDYHVQPGSDGIDQADPTTALATDLDGDPRSQGIAPDIGADEVVP